MLVFSISGTYIVDLKDTGSPDAKISSRILPDSLADLFSSMVKMTSRTNNSNRDLIENKPDIS